MKDLVIRYKNENGETLGKAYNTIMEFIDEMESDKLDIPMMDYSNVYAEFFEKKHLGKSFDTIEKLLEHCRTIVK